MIFPRSTGFLLATLTLFAVGCNLDLDTEEYPYQVPLVIDDDSGPSNNDSAAPDAGVDAEPAIDMEPAGTPRLVLTEIVINTSIMDSNVALGELGEYVEIKNIGDGPADPRTISMRLTNVESDTTGDIFVATAVSQEQLEIIRNLKPIMPGEYFVFVRHSVEESPVADVVEDGFFYDFGRYGEGVPISNSGERVLELRYNDGERIVTSDRIRWRSGNMIAANGDASEQLSYDEDVALQLRPENESPENNDVPAAWCLAENTFGGLVTGTPGGPADCL